MACLKFFFFLFFIMFHLNKSYGRKPLERGLKVLVTHPEVPQQGLDIIYDASVEVIMCESVPPKRSEILEKVKGVHGIYWASHEPLNAEILEAAGPQLRAISTMSTGFDNIDVTELKRRNISLGHTPEVVNNAVADHAIGLMIAAMHRFHEGRSKIESSEWENSRLQWLLGQDVSFATVGFFGFGRIGKTIAKRLAGFDVERILYTTRHRIDEPTERKYNASKATFDELLSQSDIIFITALLSPETRGVFNSTAFAKMKKNAVLVNIARGQIVNQNDLYSALKAKQIFAAGIDVMYPEPLPSTDQLLTLPNCVITPHIATATLRTRTQMSTLAALNLLSGLAGEPMPAPAY